MSLTLNSVLTQTIQPKSTVVSSSLAWGTGHAAATAQGAMSTADMQNVANTMSFWIAVSYDGGTTWARRGGLSWQGGAVDKSGNPAPPGMTWTPDPSQLPTHVRVELDLGQSLSVGASLGTA